MQLDERLQVIRDTPTADLLHGRDEKGVPFLQMVFQTYQEVFGQPCTGCAGKIPGYISQLKNFQKPLTKSTMKKEFKLKPLAVIEVAGTSESYSDHNLTDEKAVELIALNGNRINLFEVKPEDWQDRVAKFKDAASATAAGAPAAASDKGTVNGVEFTYEEIKEAAKVVGVTLRKQKVDTVAAEVEALDDELKKALLAQVLKAREAAASDKGTVVGPALTKEELEYELEKAEQELDDAKAISQNPEDWKEAEAKIESIKAELAKV